MKQYYLFFNQLAKVTLEGKRLTKQYLPKITSSWSWNECLRIAQKEGMSLYLAEHPAALKKLGCPKAILLTLALEKQIAGHNLLKRKKELALANQIARRSQVSITALKGSYYLRRKLLLSRFRVMSDVDILITKHNVNRFVGEAQKTGFRRREITMQRRFHNELAQKWIQFSENFLGRDALLKDEIVLDVHWEPIYEIGGHAITLKAPVSEHRTPPDAFFATHALIHFANAATQPQGLQLSRLWEVAFLIKTFAISFEDLENFWSSEQKLKVRQLLREFWNAGQSLLEANIDPFLALQSRRFVSAQWQVPSTHLFWRIHDTKDRLRFLTGYLLPTVKSSK